MQSRNVMPQVRIYALYGVSLAFVFKSRVSSIITNFRVSRISVRIVVISFGRTIYKFLYSLPTFIKGYIITHNLSSISTYQRYYVKSVFFRSIKLYSSSISITLTRLLGISFGSILFAYFFTIISPMVNFVNQKIPN